MLLIDCHFHPSLKFAGRAGAYPIDKVIKHFLLSLIIKTFQSLPIFLGFLGKAQDQGAPLW